MNLSVISHIIRLLGYTCCFLVTMLIANNSALAFDSANIVPVAETENTQDYPRFALVIGNKDYQYKPLTNPVNDAREIRVFLKTRDFNITYAENADFKTMEAKIDAFLTHLSQAKKSIAVVYYSGHGTQEMSRRYREVTNYLIPVDNERLKTVTDLDDYSVRLNSLLGKMDELNQGLNIALMDACRDGLPTYNKSTNSPALAAIPAKGIFIAYATLSGNTAADNSLFQQSFIKHASQVLKLTDVFDKVAEELNHTSQRPSIQKETVGNFYFTGNADEDPKILRANYLLAKTYENKALLAIYEGDKNKSIDVSSLNLRVKTFSCE